jgi:ATP-binding protein involved in chromosome partitioning
MDMFQKLAIPLLGVVENMSYFHCPHCLQPSNIFGKSGETALSRETTDKIKVVARIPLEGQICEWSDQGKPVVLMAADSVSAKEYLRLSATILEQIQMRCE